MTCKDELNCPTGSETEVRRKVDKFLDIIMDSKEISEKSITLANRIKIDTTQLSRKVILMGMSNWDCPVSTIDSWL